MRLGVCMVRRLSLSIALLSLNQGNTIRIARVRLSLSSPPPLHFPLSEREMHANTSHVEERGEGQIKVKYVATKRRRISDAVQKVSEP